VPEPASERRRHVFLSYARADRPWVERLKQMIKPLLVQSKRQLQLWDDSQIEAGTPWRDAIHQALASGASAGKPR
jgi:hypothetical protein